MLLNKIQFYGTSPVFEIFLYFEATFFIAGNSPSLQLSQNKHTLSMHVKLTSAVKIKTSLFLHIYPLFFIVMYQILLILRV